jgi:hypothetical protein
MQPELTQAASPNAQASIELHALLREPGADLQRIGELFDRMAEADRIAAVRSLGSREQKHLWKAAERAEPLRLRDLVPPQVPALTPVRHYGKNSLPMFTIFEKRFYRLDAEDPNAPHELCGANFQLFAPLTGPGYFIVTAPAQRAELDVDYQRLPQRAPAGWPAITRNDRGFSRLVYGFLNDALRRVSAHVTIGAPAKNGKPMGTYFVLCREELR